MIERGTVVFKDGAVDLGAAVTVSASGTATFTTSALGAGAHSITAVYSGNTTYRTSTSGPLSQNVNQVAITVTAWWCQQ